MVHQVVDVQIWQRAGMMFHVGRRMISTMHHEGHLGGNVSTARMVGAGSQNSTNRPPIPITGQSQADGNSIEQLRPGR